MAYCLSPGLIFQADPKRIENKVDRNPMHPEILSNLKKIMSEKIRKQFETQTVLIGHRANHTEFLPAAFSLKIFQIRNLLSLWQDCWRKEYQRMVKYQHIRAYMHNQTE